MNSSAKPKFDGKKPGKKRYFDAKQDKGKPAHNKHVNKKKDPKKTKNKSTKAKKQTYTERDGGNQQQEVFRINMSSAEHFHRKQEQQPRTAHKEENLADPRHIRQKNDPFPGDKPIPEAALKKYQRGERIRDTSTRSKTGDWQMAARKKKVQLAVKQAARTELLMQEDGGFIEAENGEETSSITQHDLANVVDITSANKFFELHLRDFGPYNVNYTRNGRFLLLGGAKGHLAAIDWMTKRLLCEVNVMETIHDVKWLHQETMYAVAQKTWTYIYDNQGIELHCLKKLDSVLRLEFLPFHFLLASANSKGYLSYIDVSVGEKVAGYSTQMGRLDVMCQNPSNAIIALGHSGGTVTMWCPKMREPVAKVLCHHSGVRSVAIDKEGLYMATSGIDRTMKIWDLRTWKLVQSYKVPMGAKQLTFSQRGLLAADTGNIVQVYEDCCRQTVAAPYLVHKLTSSVQSLQFCPYEDVLGVGHGTGFTSLITPGAGEPNFDALESNPYQTKKQRQETEVKMLLDKVPADMIHIDSNVVVQVDQKGLEEKIEEHNKLKSLKPLKYEYEPRYKKKGKSKGQKLVQRKKGVVEELQRKDIKQSLVQKQQVDEQRKVARDQKVMEHRTGSVLDRFRQKD